jgi:MoxR-like ATPase
MMATTLTFTSDWNKTPETRHDGSPTEPEPYVAKPPLVETVNLAIHLRRPLLLEGEAGCGKTRLARAVAYQLGLPYYFWPVRSTSKVTEGLYTYDAILRLHDVQTLKAGPSYWPWLRLKPLPATGNGGGAAGRMRNPSDPTCYREFGALGKAFQQRECPAVVLIDEIDKADIDFPNDLLTILDKPWEFRVAETGEPPIKAHEDCLPIVFITSNKEKGNLPAPFLRRCLYHFIEFPVEQLREIVVAHYPHLADKAHEELVGEALKRFKEVRDRTDLYKKPGTSELLDWFAVLSGFKGRTYPHADLADRAKPMPFPEVLFKVKADWQRFRTATP